jgi:glycosyltransferase involved in cell wall biosynthesis
MSLHIAINATALSKNQPTGVENFSVNLVASLIKYQKQNRYALISPTPISKGIDTGKAHILVSKSKYLWHKLTLPKILSDLKPDIFFEPSYMLPRRGNYKSVIVIHDLAYKYFPEAYDFKHKLMMNAAYKSAERANGVVFLSKNTESDFLKFYKKPARHQVIYQSYDEALFDSKKSNFHRSDKLGSYILSVGRLETRKNIVNLIKAYERFLRHSSEDIKLVIVGMPGIGFDKIENVLAETSKRVREKIIISGYLSDQKLVSLYKNARAFVYPTLYEGFGIPILEAFASGTPVACSNTSSLPEVAGDSALYFDPSNVQDIADSISKIVSDKKYAGSLVSAGKEQLINFSWEKCAKEFTEFFETL